MDWAIAKEVEVEAEKNPRLSFHSVNFLCERHAYLLTERAPNFVQPLRNYQTSLLIGFGNVLRGRLNDLEEERKTLKTVEERYDHDAVIKRVEKDLSNIGKVVDEREREIARMVGMEQVAGGSDKNETDDDLPGLEDSTPPKKTERGGFDRLTTDGEIKTEKVGNTIEFAVEGLTDGDSITMTINEDKKDKKDQGDTITMLIAEDNKQRVEDVVDEAPHSAVRVATSEPDPSRGDEKVVVIPAGKHGNS